MSEQQPIHEEKPAEKPAMKVTPGGAEPPRRGRGISLFAPIVLIAAGVLFLLDNLGVIGDLNWAAAAQYWPLALIFLGLNVLVSQVRRPLGTFLSALVALAAVAVFGFLLVAGSGNTMRALGLPAPSEVKAEPFAVPLDVESAEITLNLSNDAAQIAARDDDSLVSGTIWTRNGLNLERHYEGGRTEVTIGERGGGFTLFPLNWVQEGHPWEFFLSPALPLDLTIDGGNGPVSADLAALTLASLVIDSGNSTVTAALPGGEYDIRLDGGNGQLHVTLPAGGRREVRVDGGNGRIEIVLPAGAEARIEYDRGNGRVNVDGRFSRVAGGDDEGVYETAGYAAGNGVLMRVDGGNGGLVVGEQ